VGVSGFPRALVRCVAIRGRSCFDRGQVVVLAHAAKVRARIRRAASETCHFLFQLEQDGPVGAVGQFVADVFAGMRKAAAKAWAWCSTSLTPRSGRRERRDGRVRERRRTGIVPVVLVGAEHDDGRREREREGVDIGVSSGRRMTRMPCFSSVSGCSVRALGMPNACRTCRAASSSSPSGAARPVTGIRGRRTGAVGARAATARSWAI